MFKGMGDPWVRTTDKTGSAANNQRGLILELLSFELTTESASKESQKFNSNGELVTASKVKGSTSYGFTLSFNEINWGSLGFATGQFPRTASSVKIPALAYATVPSTAPYEVTDSYITASNDDDITVVSTEASGGLQPGITLTHGTSTPTAGTVYVDTTNGKFVFNAAQAGLKFAYPKFTTYSSVQDIGGPSGAVTWNKFEFWGKIYIPSISAGAIIQIPDCEIATEPSFSVSNDVPTISIECALNTPSGWNKPYRLFNMSTAAA